MTMPRAVVVVARRAARSTPSERATATPASPAASLQQQQQQQQQLRRFLCGGRASAGDGFRAAFQGIVRPPRVLGGGGGGGGGKVINRVRGDKRIVDDVWWCDTDALLRANGGLRVMWRRLAAPVTTPASWLPRFNFAAAAVAAAAAAAAAATASSGGGGGSGGSSGLVIFGGNVSTGLLFASVDAWLLLHHDADSGGDGETTTVATLTAPAAWGAAAAAAAAAAAPISGFEWVRLAATGVPDAEGHSQPYGRVHASVVVVPPHPTAAAKDGDQGHSIILVGGESTRPYMYHAGVWRASVRGVGV